jgi:deoxyribonuclease IV
MRCAVLHQGRDALHRRSMQLPYALASRAPDGYSEVMVTAQTTRGDAAHQEARIDDELGAHISTAGGVVRAPERAAELDAAVLQLFTKQPSRWAEPVVDDVLAAAFRESCATHGVHTLICHDSYLINLATPDPVLHGRSYDSFLAELRRCAMLGIGAVVTHPGNATDGDVESGMARNADAIAQALTEAGGDVQVFIETTAGAGRVLGATFEQIAALIERIPDPVRARVGVCVDTCHVWAAGYDLRTAYDDVLARFDDVVGLERLGLLHLNDSVGELGSRRDRHAEIGEGALGIEPFRRIMTDQRLHAVPKIIETPKGDDHTASDRRNLGRLRAMR